MPEPRRHDPSDHDCRGGVVGDLFDFAGPDAGVTRWTFDGRRADETDPAEIKPVMATVLFRRVRAADGEEYDAETVTFGGQTAADVDAEVERYTTGDDEPDGIADAQLIAYTPADLEPADFGFAGGPRDAEQPSEETENR